MTVPAPPRCPWRGPCPLARARPRRCGAAVGNRSGGPRAVGARPAIRRADRASARRCFGTRSADGAGGASRVLAALATSAATAANRVGRVVECAARLGLHTGMAAHRRACKRRRRWVSQSGSSVRPSGCRRRAFRRPGRCGRGRGRIRAGATDGVASMTARSGLATPIGAPGTLLLVSLALNLFFVGVGAAYVVRHYFSAPPAAAVSTAVPLPASSGWRQRCPPTTPKSCAASFAASR